MDKILSFFKHYRWQTAIIIGYLLALYPFFQYGYWMTLDFGLTPSISWIPVGGGFWLIFDSIKALSLLMPVWLAEKVIVLTILALLGWGAVRLTRQQSPLIRIFATLLILYNPWIYGRLMDGQLNVISIALGGVWLAVWLLESVRGGLTWRRGLMIVLLSGLMPAMTHHSLVIVAVVLMLRGLFCLSTSWSWRRFGQLLLIGLGVFGINSYILWGYATQSDAVSSSQNVIAQFDDSHQEAFASRGSNLPLSANLLALRGYRGEYQYRFGSLQDHSRLWWISSLILILLVILGCYRAWRDGRQREVSLMIGLGVAGWILAHGVAGWGPIGQLNQWLYDTIPLYQGMREPQKRLALLLVFYVWAGSYGLDYLYRTYLDHEGWNWLGYFLIALPLWMTPMMLFGGQGQLTVRPYPTEWKQLDQQLAGVEAGDCDLSVTTRCYSTLLLPWHGYMHFKWIGKVVGGWIGRYFGDDVLFGDTVEYANIYTQSTRPESAWVEQYLHPRDGQRWTEKSSTDWIDHMRLLGVSQLLLLKESDFGRYQGFLDDAVADGDIIVHYDNDYGTIYRFQ